MMLSVYGLSFASLGITVFAIFAMFVHFWYRVFCQSSFSGELPWAGTNGNTCRFSRMKATVTSIGRTREYLIEGYHKYSQKNKAYVLPNMITGPEVILPMSQLKWLMDQPETILHQGEVNQQFLQADHTMLHQNIVRDTVHQAVIRRELTAKLDDLNPDIVDEIGVVFNEQWGTNTHEWKEICVYETMLEVISRISNRVLVGIPLCRDSEYQFNSKHFAHMVVFNAAIINILPWCLRLVLAPLITWGDTRKFQNMAKRIVPLIRQRQEVSIQTIEEKRPNDYIQWALRHASTHWDPNERKPDMICRRLAVLSFAVIQSSVITLTNLLFDLASSPNLSTSLSTLTTEISSELISSHGIWSRKSLSKMLHLDSAIRESMRLGGFITRGISKLVMSPEGITLPNGAHVPQGGKVGVSQYSIHHDEEVYRNALTYEPFRFSETKSPAEVCCAEKYPALVTTSPVFMAFSHGSHACPGRFFAANQLKLTLAHIVLNYEIKPLAERPPNRWFGESIAPPMTERIWVRRRGSPVTGT